MSTLLLRLAAPLQAWGADSKFEIRKTNREPTKSGVIGLLAAALGLRRDADQAVQQLNGLRYGVRVDREGKLLVDYHTAGNPTPDAVKQARKTGKKVDAPYVTHRHYLSDAVFLVGLESEDDVLLCRLQQALTNPAFPLFLGRRSCPPTLPLCLGIRNAGLLDTLCDEPWQAVGRDVPGRLRVVLDEEPGRQGAVPRRDLPLSFSPIHRQFGYRAARELMVDVPLQVLLPADTAHDPFAELR